MAEVTGFTAERMLAMENATVNDARLSGDNLILVTKDATEIDVGSVRGPVGPQGPIGEVSQADLDVEKARILSLEDRSDILEDEMDKFALGSAVLQDEYRMGPSSTGSYVPIGSWITLPPSTRHRTGLIFTDLYVRFDGDGPTNLRVSARPYKRVDGGTWDLYGPLVTVNKGTVGDAVVMSASSTRLIQVPADQTQDWRMYVTRSAANGMDIIAPTRMTFMLFPNNVEFFAN